MSPPTFKKEDYADFRLNLALKKVGQKILLEILHYAVPKSQDETFHEYYLDKSYFVYKNFDSSQKEKIKINKTGEYFDITLLYKLFVHGCPDVFPPDHANWRTKGEFEYFLGKIKKVRNVIVHSSSPIPYEELGDQIQSLKNLLTALLKTAQTRFGIKEQVVKDRVVAVKNELDIIMCSPLNQTDVDEYLVTEGVTESKLRYESLSYINPVDFFVGLEFSTKIDQIFVTLEIKELKNYEEGQKISINNLLKSFVKHKLSLLIVEGLAGSGKSTLSKYILSQWIEGSSLIQGLNEFTFILFLQCNNTYITTVYDLIASIIPETSRRFGKEELVESVLCQKLLVVVDGIDEAHAGTKSVLKELFHRSKGKHIQFFCTSRPEKVHWVYRIKGDLSCGALSIVGIAEENRITFVKKLYCYYKDSIQTERLCPLNKVIQTLKKLSCTIIIKDLKLPLFLALFTYLCTVEPKKMEHLNSVVSLYNEVISALKDRLLSRSLAKNETLSSPLDEEEIKDAIEDCFAIFCDEAFLSVVAEQETLSKEFMKKIKEQSTIIGLHVKDVLSAFLVVKVVLTPFGIQEVVGFPHNGLKEFLAAKATAERLRTGEILTSVLKSNDPKSNDLVKTQINLDLDTGLMKCQNLILYLSGILVMENLLEDSHVHDIIKLFRKAGAYLSSQWLSLLVALNFHYLVCEFILMKFNKLDIDEYGFDTFIALLQYNCPKEIVLRVNSDSCNISKLRAIITLLNKYVCNLKLVMRYFVRYPQTKINLGNNLLNILTTKNSRCNLNWYEGTATECEIQSLPESIRGLFLGIGTQQQAKALSLIGITSDILYIKLHILREVEPMHLPKIPEMVFFFVFLSDVKSTFNDVIWVISVLSRLNESRKYDKILFPRSELNAKTVYKILHQMEKLKFTAIGGRPMSEVEKGGIYVCSSLISAAEEKEIKAFCCRIWGCKFALMSEEEIWVQ